MVTIYLCGIAVLIACVIGIPIGIAAARSDPVHRVVSVVIDTLQTLPSFVYLIPVVMLFRVGDFAAMLAVSLPLTLSAAEPFNPISWLKETLSGGPKPTCDQCGHAHAHAPDVVCIERIPVEKCVTGKSALVELGCEASGEVVARLFIRSLSSAWADRRRR